MRPKWKFIGLHKTADHALAIQPDLIYRSPSAAILARKAKASVAVSDEGSWLCKTLSWRKCLGVQGSGIWRKLLGSREGAKNMEKFKAFSSRHHTPPFACCNGTFFTFPLGKYTNKCFLVKKKALWHANPPPLTENALNFSIFFPPTLSPGRLNLIDGFFCINHRKLFNQKSVSELPKSSPPPLGLKKDASPNLSSKPFFFTLVLLFIPEASCCMS